MWTLVVYLWTAATLALDMTGRVQLVEAEGGPWGAVAHGLDWLFSTPWWVPAVLAAVTTIFIFQDEITRFLESHSWRWTKIDEPTISTSKQTHAIDPSSTNNGHAKAERTAVGELKREQLDAIKSITPPVGLTTPPVEVLPDWQRLYEEYDGGNDRTELRLRFLPDTDEQITDTLLLIFYGYKILRGIDSVRSDFVNSQIDYLLNHAPNSLRRRNPLEGIDRMIR
jgi:hypothetical protein